MPRLPESHPLHDSADEPLVHLVVSEGSEDAFRVLYRRYSPRLHRTLRWMLASESDADDVLQETWMRAVAGLGQFAGRATLCTWLTAIAVNAARELLERRRRWVDVELEEEMMGSEEGGIDQPLDLKDAIALLPAGCRAAFVLHDIEGYTHEEIAGQLGYTPGTSKTQVFRARRALRRLLGAEVEESKHGSS